MTGDIRETAIDHVAGEKIATFFSSARSLLENYAQMLFATW
jgi:hypothetical protein